MIRRASIITRLEKHRKKAKELRGSNLEDYLVFNTLAMECFQAVNSAVDLGELIVSEKNLGFPSNYSEIFELLRDAGRISNKALGLIKRLIFLRNLIAHEYHVISKKELKEMAGLLDVLDELVTNNKK